MASSLVFLSFVFLAVSASSASAFNITRLLNDFSDFSTFNGLLTQTHLASQINSRQTITVLAVDNGAVSSVSGSSSDVQKNVLSVHVILDYYDVQKLRAGKKSRLVTTLFQSSGLASNQMGFLNITIEKSSGDIMLGSASPGSSLSSKVVGEVVTRPYNISVLHVTSLIQPPGIENVNASSEAPTKSPSKPPAKSPSKAPAPASAPTPDVEAPEADTPEADAPEADSPSDAPEADTPSDAPSSAGAPDGADGPSADGPGKSADGPAADDSGAARVALGSSLGAVVGVVCSSIMALM
ncbi:hypothetical protein ACLOJK_030666 [Asimina triloba]